MPDVPELKWLLSPAITVKLYHFANYDKAYANKITIPERKGTNFKPFHKKSRGQISNQIFRHPGCLHETLEAFRPTLADGLVLSCILLYSVVSLSACSLSETPSQSQQVSLFAGSPGSFTQQASRFKFAKIYGIMCGTSLFPARFPVAEHSNQHTLSGRTYHAKRCTIKENHV